jgi:hypothetical protein
MRMPKSSLLICLLLALLSSGIAFSVQSAGPKGTVYKIIVPKQGNLVANPGYFCWLPESVATYRCIIVHQHGCTRERDASQMMSDVQWISLAKKWNAVFIACSLTTGSDCGNWNNINNGSANTYLAALDSLAKRSNHSEITTIPWALWGHSGGAGWVTSMTGKYPERVVATIAQSCASEISNIAAALRVPILHHNGQSDICHNDSYFTNGRGKGALWAHAINPVPVWVTQPTAYDANMEGHAPHDLRMIAIPWIDIGLTMRLPAQAGQSTLKDEDTSNAWLGDKTTKAISSAATYTGNRLAACWFPNQYFAQKWAEYMVTGTLNDSTPPPAPYNLTGAYANRQIVLKWDADADLETGIKTFIIYRNGSILQTMQWPNAPTTLFTTAKGYQRWEDGDQPDPVAPPNMTFTDNNLSDTGTYSYQVSTVNWSGFASVKSSALVLKGGQIAAVKVPRNRLASSFAPVSRRFNLDNGVLDLMPGILDIYDIRGCLLKSVSIKDGGRMDVRRFLGPSAGNIVMVRNRSR